MSTYFEHNERRGRPDAVALDVIEFDDGIEVQAQTFESRADLLAHVAKETGKAP
jgi:hypothetical protein